MVTGYGTKIIIHGKTTSVEDAFIDRDIRELTHKYVKLDNAVDNNNHLLYRLKKSIIKKY